MITNLRKCILESWDGDMGELARAVHVSPTLLSFWVNARRPIPGWHVLTLSRVLGRNPSELIGMADLTDDMAEVGA